VTLQPALPVDSKAAHAWPEEFQPSVPVPVFCGASLAAQTIAAFFAKHSAPAAS